jgi:hypothetical protein
MSLHRIRSTSTGSGEHTFVGRRRNQAGLRPPPREPWGFVAARAAARLPGAPDWTKISNLRMFWLT